MPFSVYIIQSQKDSSFYVGYSADMVSRLQKHNNARKGYTATKQPWELVYEEKFATKREAIVREKYIKSQKSKEFILTLIKTNG